MVEGLQLPFSDICGDAICAGRRELGLPVGELLGPTGLNCRAGTSCVYQGTEKRIAGEKVEKLIVLLFYSIT
jgi:hypothetical protein